MCNHMQCAEEHFVTLAALLSPSSTAWKEHLKRTTSFEKASELSYIVVISLSADLNIESDVLAEPVLVKITCKDC